MSSPVTGRLGPPSESRARRRGATVGVLLVTLTAVPAAVLVSPDAASAVVPAAVKALGPGDAGVAGLLRATGLSLPALLLTVPLAAVAARRFSALFVLILGLAVLVTALVAARFAHSLAVVGTVRAAQGAGAGIVLPASLVLVWERGSGVLCAVWAGALTGSLLVAMPLALDAVPPDADWHVALAPHLWPAAAAVAAAILGLALRRRVPWALPAFRRIERGQLILPLAPVAGFAFLAVVATDGWSPGGRLAVAALALPALLGLALAGSRDATAGSPLGCAVVFVTTGLLTYPVAGPLAGLADATARVRDGAQGVSPLPFAVAAVAALLGALTAARLSADGARRAVPAGHALMILAVLLGVVAGTGHGRWTPLVPLLPLGAGAGLALAASLCGAAATAALFGLSLCFPAVLAGQMLALSLQASRLERIRPATEAQQLYGLVDGYRVWLVVAGGMAVLLAAASRRLTARCRAAPRPHPHPHEAVTEAAGG